MVLWKRSEPSVFRLLKLVKQKVLGTWQLVLKLEVKTLMLN